MAAPFKKKFFKNKKKKIAGDIIQTDESIPKKLNKNDINELFIRRLLLILQAKH